MNAPLGEDAQGRRQGEAGRPPHVETKRKQRGFVQAQRSGGARSAPNVVTQARAKARAPIQEGGTG